MKRLILALAAASGLLTAASAPALAADSHALINGSGSSWAEIAVNQWVADVQANGLKVVYTADGSASGRKDFAQRIVDFSVSDTGFQGTDETGAQDTSNGRGFAYLPITGGGTAFPYHVEVAGKLVKNLRLSGETIAKIFTNQITDWDDPEITRDNNGNALPELPIIPVVHSEGAGTSLQFTKYLASQFPSIWSAFNGGSDAPTEFYPAKGKAIAQDQSDGVMNYVASSAADGAIGMDEYAYPLQKGYPSIKLENAAGYYTLPTQYNVAVALTQAQINNDPSSPDYLLQTLDNVYTDTDPRAYALSSYAYAIIPTDANDSTMSTAKRQTIADYLYYSICQGQSEIGPIGYSSLPINLVEAGFDQIAKLKTADPGVDLTQRDVSTCNNPTFIAGHPDENYLAQIAPQPAACDKDGAGPCATTAADTAANANPSPTAAASTKSGAATKGTTSAGAKATTPGGAAPTTAPAVAATDPATGGALPTASSGQAAVVDPITGATIAPQGTSGGGSSSGGDDAVAARVVPTELTADPQSSLTSIMAPAAAVELLAVLFVPPLLYRWLRRRRVRPS